MEESEGGGREEVNEASQAGNVFCFPVPYSFKLWRVLFVCVRVLTVVISILTLW